LTIPKANRNYKTLSWPGQTTLVNNGNFPGYVPTTFKITWGSVGTSAPTSLSGMTWAYTGNSPSIEFDKVLIGLNNPVAIP
jgi:hypothetical protein